MPEHVLGGRYHLQRPVGHGGMATVWQARDTRLDRSAAVKVLDAGRRADPVALERLRREARSVARLAHRNIVGVYDVEVDDDAAYLVMELVEGRSLTEALLARRRLPVGQAVSIAAQICDALAAAHAAGVVHRDIKPSNILVDQAGVVKVCDFGVALLQQAASQAALTAAGAVVGTCQYMAPEQAVGDPVDGRADLYAVGCVLYAMLAGDPPFSADHPIDVLDLHLNEPPVPLRAHRDDIPPDLHLLVDQLLAKDAADRPGTAWSVRDRLTAIGGVTAELPEYRPPPSGDPAATGRHRTITLAAPVIRRRRRWARGRVLVPAAGALAATVLATTVLTGGGQPAAPVRSAPPPATSPSAAASPSSAVSSSKPAEPASSPATSSARPSAIDQITGLATLLQRQADIGRLTPKAAKTLVRDLDNVVRRLGAGKTAEAAGRFADFRDQLSELSNDGELTAAGSAALPDLDQIAESLRAS